MNLRWEHRHLELDLLRAVAIIMMVIYHAAYDLAFFYGAPMHPWEGGWLILQRVTANLFLLLVGVSFAVSYGRMEARDATQRDIISKYVKRGCLVFFCGMLVTLATYAFDHGTYVRFGILHLIGAGILLLPFVMPLREGNVILAVIAFLMGRAIHGITAPISLLLPFGIPPAGFVSVDYFPLFPWIAAMLTGAAVGNALYNRRWLRWHVPDNRWTRILTEPGRHALIIYLVHQPVLLMILWMVYR